MSTEPPVLPAERLEQLWSWGLATSAMSYVYRPSTAEGIVRVFELARARGLTVGLRGAGQSYGDAALNTEHVALDLSRMTRILAWDPDRGIVTLEPGVTIGQLWQYAIEDGWWPYVVPGTMCATLGGAAAMNIHGKNNWRVGPLGDHVLEFDLLLPSGERRRCSRRENAALFHAAIGGFGMLGCLVSLTLELKKVHSGLLAVEPLAVGNLDEMLAAFEERMDRADYLVGWVDGFARGGAMGRGLVHAARYLDPGEDPSPAQTLRAAHQGLPETLLGVVPRAIMWRLMRPFMNPLGTRVVNAAKYHLGRRERGHGFRQPHAQFNFLLDYIPDWKRALGRGGMIQYQSFVPAAQAARVFNTQLALAQQRGLVPYLGVLKRHRADPFLMTHGLDGYSLALEFRLTARNRPSVWVLAAAFDELVLGARGRFYFAKDSTLDPARLESYLHEERVQGFLALKRDCDPERLLQTDLFRRIFGREVGEAETPVAATAAASSTTAS
jgi:decaprenylphospho-beta-D-ribofuranose 2-oxidase